MNAAPVKRQGDLMGNPKKACRDKARPISQVFALELLEKTKHLIPVGSKDECWNYGGHVSKTKGYGIINEKGKKFLAPRVVYVALRGEIPEGLEPDHTCRNRRCVNPWHLDLVTSRINTLRGASVLALNFAKTHCKRGHLFDEENTTVVFFSYRRPKRLCRACNKMRLSRKRRETRGEPVEPLSGDALLENFQCADQSRLKENEDRLADLIAKAFNRGNAAKTHCPQGHPYSPENTRKTKGGDRKCVACNRDRCRREYRAKHRGENRSNAAKTHCPQGHPYSLENTYRNKEGHRACRVCYRHRKQKSRQNRPLFTVAPLPILERRAA